MEIASSIQMIMLTDIFGKKISSNIEGTFGDVWDIDIIIYIQYL